MRLARQLGARRRRLGDHYQRRWLGDGEDISMDPSQAHVYEETGVLDQQNATIVANQISQYTQDQIMQAFNTLNSTYKSESADLAAMMQWLNDNGSTLTPEGMQLYQSSLQTESDVVNGLQSGVSRFSTVIRALGYSAPGLSGLGRRRARLGVFPVLLGVLLSIIAIVIGVGVYEHYKAQSDQAHADIERAKALTAAYANVPELVRAGYTPQQIADYLKQAANANKSSELSKVPWGTIAVVGGVVLVAKSVFG